MLTTTWHSRYNLNSRLKTKFRRKLIALQKTNPCITPFTNKTKDLASNWWGKAWNANLKKYTVNNIHLEKGKLLFRCEALADFKIDSNTIKAIVLGSKIKPYEIKITIKPVSEAKWASIQGFYEGYLECFEKILDNHFPGEMSDIFSNKATGIFPSQSEMSFTCSCSERANLCKHTAVALYALGAKIDNDPKLLFKLRGVDILDLISKSIHSNRKSILKKAKIKSLKILKNTDLSDIFNIEIQTGRNL
ncbi:MAG: hypothetical protein A2Y03_07855 [Omnitrophica WOR_2 bacterium GWF2_38_59]|nr:MAG: hypothetical protein A2Y06_00820 [Omnitrophica WOR_2 bacterium GWA2_37_7]OGX23589.1 MAG: hypothetical protein A2Y03_07855 [Omnitrophica WOR_2 bacterium GWF2_38_59]OGX47266.1 MAG: hypothetical protein A2243_03960 [Omnitrophica WOR_2 bacterium RIFOXYA2_FULL_38_17]OGX53843.1 MAG: hypothetical protein A2267_08860 [Omnitrophica WOR_2 bacterium RIFOXYA12_FULL_38_10]OGX55448.1 MAG: hypothetical protein A2447_01805 [Omnitrophica WOR_2 bacterium RIFOXYC2_FULL_38_12]OGX58037.1 MAG: hypothetical 